MFVISIRVSLLPPCTYTSILYTALLLTTSNYSINHMLSRSKLGIGLAATAENLRRIDIIVRSDYIHSKR